MAAWFRSNTAISRSMDSSMTTPRSARPYVPSSSANGSMEAIMIDMLINEIQTHITRLEDEQEKRRQEMLESTRTPDYSWLMDWKLKTKKNLGFRECAAIEMMCRKIRPSEWGALIKEWRTRVRYVEARDDVISVFRQVVDEIVNERCSSRNSVRLVDELARSEDASSLHEKQSPIGELVTSRHPSPQPQNQRSISVAELSIPGLLFSKQFNEMHEIV